MATFFSESSGITPEFLNELADDKDAMDALVIIEVLASVKKDYSQMRETISSIPSSEQSYYSMASDWANYMVSGLKTVVPFAVLGYLSKGKIKEGVQEGKTGYIILQRDHFKKQIDAIQSTGMLTYEDRKSLLSALDSSLMRINEAIECAERIVQRRCPSYQRPKENSVGDEKDKAYGYGH